MASQATVSGVHVPEVARFLAIFREREGLEAHKLMTGDDIGGDVWTVAGAW